MANPKKEVSGEALVRIQRERVNTSMLIEVLVLLVFLAMAFAFVKDNEKRLDNIQEQLEQEREKRRQAENEVKRLSAINERLIQENQALQRSLRRSLAQRDGTLLPNDQYVLVREKEFTEQVGISADLKRIVADQQKDIQQLNNRLNEQGRGGSDRPRCRVASGDYIVKIEMLAGGQYRVSPNWPSEAGPEVARVPGLIQLANSSSIGRGEFERLAAQMNKWGRDQSIPCGFYAVATLKHSSLSTYRQQQQVISRYFYAAWR